MPTTDRARLRLHDDPEAARAVPRLRDGGHTDRFAGGGSVVGQRGGRGSLPLERGVSHRRASETDRGLGRARRHVDRPDLRQAVRPGHAAPLDSARDRERRFVRRLRLQLRLRLFRSDQLVVADDADADDDRSAHGVREPVRRRRHARGARRPAAGQQEHPRRHHCGRSATSNRISARAIADASTLISKACAKSSDASSRIEQYNASGAERELPEAPIGVPDSWEDHVKLMFDLQVLAFCRRSHARLVVQDEPRHQQASVSRERHQDAVPLDVASRLAGHRRSPNTRSSTPIT